MKTFKTKNTLFAILVIISILSINAQTGPGGVGTTDGTSNLVLWLDANKINATNGNVVTNWTDQSGNGFDFIDGNGAIFNTNKSNGYPAFNFNGSSNYFEKSFESKLNTNNFTVFTANNVTSSSLYKAVLSNRDDPPGDDRSGYILYARPSNNDWSFWTGITSYWLTTESNVSTSGVWSHQIIRYNGNTDFKELFIDGDIKASSTHGMILNTIRPFRIGTGRNESTPDYYFEGDISETIIYDIDINNTEQIIVSNYLSAKYDTTLAANDFYTQDDPANGDFDHNVAGIGKQLMVLTILTLKEQELYV